MSPSRATSPWLLVAGVTVALTFVVLLVSILGRNDLNAPARLAVSGDQQPRTHPVFPFPRSGSYMFAGGAPLDQARDDAAAPGRQRELPPPVYSAATSTGNPSARLAPVAARTWLLPVRPIETAP